VLKPRKKREKRRKRERKKRERRDRKREEMQVQRSDCKQLAYVLSRPQHHLTLS
jgi:hypothetical protein